MHKEAVARVWQGRTREAIAQEYASYLYEAGDDVLVDEWGKDIG
jgi:hypothetical protein